MLRQRGQTQIGARWGWRTAFFVAGVPAVLLGLVLWKYLREPKAQGDVGRPTPKLSDYLSLLRYHNMWLCCLVIIPTESVPSEFHATAIGLATLVGEIVGGTLAPAFSGAVADRLGLAASLWIAAGGAVLVFVAGLFMKETAPARYD